MKRINTYSCLEQTLENFYSTVEDRDAKWPFIMLQAAIAIASIKKDANDRIVVMAVKALGTLSDLERQAFLSEWEIPPIVERNLDTELGWPEMNAVVTYPGMSVNDTEAYRAYAIDQVNYLAGRERLKLITNIPGQDMIYLQKESEAIAYLSEDPEPATLENYPFLEAEVGITATTALEVAQTYYTLSGQFKAAGAALENARLGAIVAIEGSTDAAVMEATLEAYKAGIANAV